MTPFLQLAITLIIILLVGKVAGYLTTRLGQPSVLGELIVGLILGPSLLDITHLAFVTDTHLGEVVHQLGELGVLLLMFVAGLELHLSELARNTKVSAYSGILGVLLPVGMGYLFGRFFGLDVNPALFLGLTMGATSVSISAQTLLELKVLRSRVGLGLLGAAVFDDILVILLLSGFLALNTGDGGGVVEILIIIFRMALFLGLSVGFGLYILPKITHFTAKLPISQGTLTLALVIMLVYGVVAELVGGMAAITGTFVAGLMYSRTPEKARLESGLVALSYSFFVPIFFISIGLNIDLKGLNPNTIWLVIGISIMAVIGKWFGAGIGAKAGGFSWHESIQLGAGMISRGEVGLIVASVGLSNGLLDEIEFSAVVAMVLITTMITPPILRALFKPKTTISGEQEVAQ